MNRYLPIVALSSLLLTACGEQDEILQGQREALRDDVKTYAVPPEVAGSAAISFGAAVQNAEWSHSADNAAHVIPNAAFSGAMTPQWNAKIGQGNSRRHRITATPIVAEGRVFTLDSRALVSAFSQSGGLLWQHDLTPARDRGNDASGGGLAIGGGLVYAASGFGILTALDPATGGEVWTQKLQASGAASPTYADGIVYLVSRDNRAWALDAENGRILWDISGAPDASGLQGGGAPAVSDTLALFPFSSGELIATFREGGFQRWQAEISGQRRGFAFSRIGDLTGDPVISGGRVYAGNVSGRLAAFNLDSGERLWSVQEGPMGTPLVAGGSVFIVSDRNQLMRLDASDGSVIWSVGLPMFSTERERRQKRVYAHYGPILANGQLIVASSDGLIRRFDPRNGALTGTREIPGGAAAAPALAGGTLYVVSANGLLHAFR